MQFFLVPEESLEAMMEIRKTLHLTVAPRHDEFSRAIAVISDDVKIMNQHAGIKPEFNLFHLRLALDEALLNAQEHGCRHTSEGMIKITARISFRDIEVAIEDPGFGFTHSDVKFDSQKNLENLIMRGMKKGKGWGLPIIQSVTRGLFWNAIGNRITLLFNR